MAAHEGGIDIRLATSEDAPHILACLAAAFAPYKDLYTAEAFEDTVLSEATIAERMSKMKVLVAVEHLKVVGTISVGIEPVEVVRLDTLDDKSGFDSNRVMTAGHIRGMGVVPDRQGKGIAEQLLQKAERMCARQGCKCVTLDTTEPLKRAQRFYQKQGYRPTGLATHFFGMALIELAKTLPQSNASMS